MTMATRPITPVTYFLVFAALLVLTLTTVLVALAPLGEWHTAAALAIAVVKATLVVLFFMHVLHSPRLTWVVIGGAVFWLGIMLVLTLSDYLSRGWLTY
jgi:cytochrome c oxidase subunit 4